MCISSEQLFKWEVCGSFVPQAKRGGGGGGIVLYADPSGMVE